MKHPIILLAILVLVSITVFPQKRNSWKNDFHDTTGTFIKLNKERRFFIPVTNRKYMADIGNSLGEKMVINTIAVIKK